MNNVIVWLALAVVFAVIEASTASLVSIWFVVGAVAAAFAAAADFTVWVQIPVFIFVSLLALAITKPLVKKLKRHTVPTNADRLIGTNGIVTEEIDAVKGTGSVKVSGMDWTARSSDSRVIPVGTIVKVERIEGVKLIVREG